MTATNSRAALHHSRTGVRVNAQLIDGKSGAHLWADRFEDELADLFKCQDQVVARLANALGFELVRAAASKSAHSTSSDAIGLTMRGWKLSSQIAKAMVGIRPDRYTRLCFRLGLHPDSTLTSPIAVLTKALAIDPG